MKITILKIAAGAALVLSCKAKVTPAKPVDTSTPAAAPTANNSSLISKLSKAAPFSQVKINSTVNVQNGKFVPPLDATIYIEDGKKIWMNLTAVFLNVARGIATPEGVKAYAKPNKTYIDQDFGYINKLLNVNFIDYQGFQNLLLGRTFVPVNEDFALAQNSNGYTLASAKNQVATANGKRSEYKMTLSYSPDFNLTSVEIQDAKTPGRVNISYGERVQINNMSLPKNVKIIINNGKESRIYIENTKFDFSTMETPYSVPKDYTKTVIK